MGRPKIPSTPCFWRWCGVVEVSVKLESVCVSEIADNWYLVYGVIDRRDVEDIDACACDGVLHIDLWFEGGCHTVVEIKHKVFEREGLVEFPIYTGRGTFLVFVTDYLTFSNTIERGCGRNGEDDDRGDEGAE